MKRHLSLLVVLFALFTTLPLPAQTRFVQKNVLLEEFTGAWCSYCPGVRPFLDSLAALYPNLVIAAIHSGGPDAMQIDEGKAIADTFRPPAYPTAMIDRVLWSQNYGPARASEKWIAHIEEQLARPGTAEVRVLASYDPESRRMTATVTSEFVTNVIAGEFRLNLYIVEDGVTASGSGYDQYNSYNGVAGHPYFGAGNPIVGYVHDHVLRAVPSGPQGTPGIVPYQPEAGTQYSTNYNYTLPAGINPAKVKLIGFLSYFGADWSNREVMNVTEVPLIPAQADAEGSNDLHCTMQLHPTPAQNELRLELSIPDGGEVAITVVDLFGREVKRIDRGYLGSGHQSLRLDVGDLSNGTYHLQVVAGAYRMTGKVMVAR